MAVDSTDESTLKCIGTFIVEYKIAIIIILVIYILYFTISNSMFIYALLKTRTGPISNTSLIFIFLSLSDIIIGVVLCPHVIYRYEQNISQKPSCNIGSSTWLVPQWLFSALSAYTGVLVGIHRYIKVRFNDFYKRYLTKRPYVVISFIGLILLAVLPTVVSIYNPPVGSMLFGVIGIIGYIISLLTCFLLARQWRKDSNDSSSQSKERKLSEEAKHAIAKTRTITILAVVLCVTWTPVITTAILTFAVSRGANMSEYARRVIDACYEWTRLFLVLNSGLNATIYMVRTFRISKLFGRGRDASLALKKSHSDFVDDATGVALKSAMRIATVTLVHNNDTFLDVTSVNKDDESVETAGFDNAAMNSAVDNAEMTSGVDNAAMTSDFNRAEMVSEVNSSAIDLEVDNAAMTSEVGQNAIDANIDNVG